MDSDSDSSIPYDNSDDDIDISEIKDFEDVYIDDEILVKNKSDSNSSDSDSDSNSSDSDSDSN